ncbi:MAG: lysophospholipid acyltransferase family protein [Candidatus Omnitrophica bacterium]|nr:lysophospholipid acyltransferase family protein [Candidatus Omnitrophota bacterium]
MLNYFLYRLGQFIALHLPLKLGYKIAVFVSNLHYLLVDKDRERVAANLKSIFPEKTRDQIAKIRITMFRNFAKYLVDFFRFEKLDKEYIRKNIKIENLHYLDEALSKGRGVITLSAHLGNWELGGVVVALLGYPFWAVVLPHKYKKVDNFFNQQRESKGVKVIPLPRAVRTSLGILKENKIVALVGDRDFKERGMVLDFLGRPTILPIGPAAFSLRTGAIIVPVFMLRNGDDSFTLSFEKPIEFIGTGNNEKDKIELINRYKVIIEDYIRRFPDQWYMFRRFWVQ